MLRSIADDLRFALRLHANHPWFALAAVSVLGLGLAANLTVFGLFNAAFLAPMPCIRDTGSLALVGRTERGRGFRNTSYPDYRDLRANVKAFAHLAAQQPMSVSVADDTGTGRIGGASVSANYFAALGVRAAAGRLFHTDEDDEIGKGAVAVISDALWERRWRRDPRVIGRRILVNSTAVDVIGVAEPGFRGNWLPASADIWIPLSMYDHLERTFVSLTARDATWMNMFGRLAPGVTRAQADAQLEAAAAAIRPLHAAGLRGAGYRTARFNSLGEEVATSDVAQFMAVMGGLTALGLLVVCANVANLLLARASTRRREVAIRLSIGAGRMRVIRQMLVEGVLLGVGGVAAGVAASAWGVEWLVSMIPGEAGGRIELQPAWNVALVAYAAALALVSTAAFALPAAWQASSANLVSALKAGEANAGPARMRLRGVLAVAQVALCVVLLSAAGLLGRSVQLLERADLGIEMDRLLVAGVDLQSNGYTQEAGKAFYAQLRERLRGLPGVTGAALARMTAFSGGSMSLFGLYGGAVDRRDAVFPYTNVQSPGYFQALGLPMLQGRDFDERDNAAGRPVAVINEALARRLFPDRPALGQTLRTTSDRYPAFEVIGVTRNGLAPNPADGATRPALHLSLDQLHNWNLAQTIHVRAAGDPAALFAAIRRTVSGLDPNVPVFGERTQRAVFDESFFVQRLGRTIAMFSGLMAMAVAAIGLYGLLAFHVAQRTREIGLRIALGASPAGILRMTIAGGLRLGAFGIAAGIALSLALTRALSSLLYGVRPNEPVVIAGAAAVLALATFAASAWPAWRAVRIEPSRALRWE